jgi:2-oxo-4-hydroxy-4-carboxy--5-ureidoimidazoline (OHCU) decarboxylase
LHHSERQELEQVYRRLKELNDLYEKKFGFKFVVWVAGRPKSAIIPILEQRLNNTASEELNTGLKAMLDIARDRLSKLLPQNKL